LGQGFVFTGQVEQGRAAGVGRGAPYPWNGWWPIMVSSERLQLSNAFQGSTAISLPSASVTMDGLMQHLSKVLCDLYRLLFVL